jgi:hypothetical protein
MLANTEEVGWSGVRMVGRPSMNEGTRAKGRAILRRVYTSFYGRHDLYRRLA